MNPRRIAFACFFVLALVFTSASQAAGPAERSNPPRIRVWTDDGFRQFQKEGGVFLDPSRIYDLTLVEGRSTTFHWSVLPAGQALAARWSVDLADITDNTPRSGPDDLAHWSPWSADENAATVGPFTAGSEHFFYLEAENDVAIVSLLTVRIRVVSAPEPGVRRAGS